VKRLEQILSRLVNKVFENDFVSLVKIQRYSNSIFLENKKLGMFLKTRRNSEHISDFFFKNDIASLVKIQIDFFEEIKNQKIIVKRLEQIMRRLMKEFFKKDIV
jgi:glutathionyl-hydroquinone reductase